MNKFTFLLLALISISNLKGQTLNFTLLETYERHTHLAWEVSGITGIEFYRIFRSNDQVNYEVVKTLTAKEYLDFSPIVKLDTFSYYIEGLNGLQQFKVRSDTVTTIEKTMTDDELLDMVQRYTFRYFWEGAHEVSGMARERNNSGDIVTTGGSGFGVMSLLVGIENGYITREQGVNRLITILSFLQFSDKFHGVFPHWLNGKTGKTVPFSTFDNGGDLVETALLMQGLLTAKQFFSLNTPEENAIRSIIKKLYEDVDWQFHTRNNSGVLYWHWSPNYAWQVNLPVRGYNEALIVYLLAIASPTHPIPASYYHTGWAGGNYENGNSWFGHKLYVGPSYGGPLFFAHYSYLGFDPRGIRDEYANYFLQNRNHTLINREYAIYNPQRFLGYGPNSWGLTASDDPFGYLAHEPGARDNGTISPTAALSSMPYTPEESMGALRHFYFNLGQELLGFHGFYDAFNPTRNWVADSYLAIDQGPIIGMIQNHRTGLLWKHFMQNPEIAPALESIGFVPDSTTSSTDIAVFEPEILIYPNPATDHIFIDLPTNLGIPNKVELYGLNQKAGELMLNNSSAQLMLPSNLTDGVYFIRIVFGQKSVTKKILVVNPD